VLFNSYPFLFGFLPVACAVFFVIGRWSRPAAAAWLAAASLAFYAWWDIRFVPILVGSVLWNFAAGLVILNLRRRGRGRMSTVALTVAVVTDLAVLGYFKYVNFFIDTANSAFGMGWPALGVILPLGISFFTFTQIAFLVDTARSEVKEVNFIHYALFVTYFPHLIAGPILHHKEMMPQFANWRTYAPSFDNFAVGIAYFAIGLAKKCLIADGFAPDATAVFNAAAQGHALGALMAWKGAIAYTLQLYFDFSGYVDMAIGLSMMFGIRLPLNFNSPYKSTSIIEFWRRWHMTLSRFLRDYLYISLGGNRRGRARRYLNLMLTMLLGGLWHGAAWTFVVWGGLHGIYLVVNHAWVAIKPAAALSHVPAAVRHSSAVAVTFLAVLLAWVFFRAADIPTALAMLASMAGINGLGWPSPSLTTDIDVLLLAAHVPPFVIAWKSLLVYLSALFIVFALPNSQQFVESDLFRRDSGVALVWRPGIVSATAMALAVSLCVLLFSSASEFLYFQF
jgi:alginate O-acetyltransferase complex protein AlgI